MEVLVVVHRVVEVLGVSGRLEEPNRGPCQLVAVIRALVISLGAAYRLVIKTAINIGESVQALRVLETLGAVLGIDAAEDDARGRESGSRFAGEIRTYDRLMANRIYYTNVNTDNGKLRSKLNKFKMYTEKNSG